MGHTEVNSPVIAINCRPGQLPNIIPPAGLNYVDFTYSPAAGNAGPIGVGSFNGRTGSKVSWPSEGVTMTMYCEFTAHGDVELYDLRFNLHVSFHDVDTKPDGQIMNGSLVGERDWPIAIGRISGSYSFGFYAFSTSKYMVYVTFPPSAKFVDGLNSQQKEARLLPINWVALSFAPASSLGSNRR